MAACSNPYGRTAVWTRTRKSLYSPKQTKQLLDLAIELGTLASHWDNPKAMTVIHQKLQSINRIGNAALDKRYGKR
jgi:hypothetical protein